jgi:hypothetical protein
VSIVIGVDCHISVGIFHGEQVVGAGVVCVLPGSSGEISDIGEQAVAVVRQIDLPAKIVDDGVQLILSGDDTVLRRDNRGVKEPGSAIYGQQTVGIVQEANLVIVLIGDRR